MDELEEVVIHTVPYAGFPTAINALNALHALTAVEEDALSASASTT